MSKVRLGGMALTNGVLVHGPTAWACAVRAEDGTIKTASGRKRLFAQNVQQPFLRGPLRLAESFAFLPELRRRLPEARLPFERPYPAGVNIPETRTGAYLRAVEISGPDGVVFAKGLSRMASATVQHVQTVRFVLFDGRALDAFLAALAD